MTALNKQALRKLAKVLSGQEWVAFVHKASGTYAVGSLGHERGEDIIKWPGFDGQDNAESKAKFIAAASPAAMLEFLDELEAEKNMREAAEKRIAELESREIKPVAWMRNTNATSFMSRFTTDKSYAVEQWGDDAVALYTSPVNFKLACFTDERNLKYINEKGRETSLIWSERNSEDGDVQLFRAAGIGVKGE
ncbi:TPA: ead/Ea22-like family protein [Citrobacter freundii]|uniref:ead/Ea22-like family protein n=1 Tax=Citrobacter freundii TaxID=546 RepID=UPI000EF280BE|nr:ead/Ea22-like family protein [Citrobacter freundii]AYL56898.1 hypothetical protein CUC48_10130 [Citrobacter freundii]HCL6719420.1 ead/Ea22-like family protein [Citrobacter freundii]